MFFVLSKVLWFVTNPGNMLLLFLLLGMTLLWTRWRRAGRRLVSAVAVIGVTLAVFPFGGWLVGVLEDRFPAVTTPPARVDGVIVAGGIVDPVLSDDRGQVAIGGAAERLFEMAALAKKYPRARLVFSGGSGSLIYQDRKEAHAVKPLLRQLGIDLKRVIFEDRSRNTAENAAFSYRLVKPKKGEAWLLVTSAFHMPRAVGSFRQAGWEVIPYPVDYMTRGKAELPLQFNFARGLGSLGGALHEFLGLLFYWLDGKTDQLFPGPRR
ncbi:MAG: YdcF family protein [Proteobacteria bacterium]|nr:YdcF family protein [Pseudomonadota bacterium]